MVDFSIDGKRYTLNYLWETVTLRQVMRLAEIKTEAETVEAALDGGEPGVQYMCDVLAVLSDCPAEVLKQTEPVEVRALFTMCVYVLRGVYRLNIEQYRPQGAQVIRFKGVDYHMPDTVQVEGEQIAMYREQAKNVVEVSNLMQMLADMKEKGVHMLKYICAIYLRPAGVQEYDEQGIAKRAELFADLPMWIVWEVFFCNYFYIANSLHGLAGFSRAVKTGRRNTILGCWLWLRKAWRVRYKQWSE